MITKATSTKPAPPSNPPSTEAAPVAVALAGLAYAYGPRQALADLSLEIPAGEIFAVLGPNGGGKTTLFRLLSTLVPPQRGNATIFGYDLRRDPVEIRRRLGVVFQSPSLDRKLTVAENIRLQAALYGLRGKEVSRRMDDLLARFGLADRAGDLTERLSGGLRRRVELAKSLIHAPDLLLLDEPSTGLDPAARIELWNYLTQLRETEGTTVLLTTHYLDEADGADRLLILNEGRLVALGAPDELRAQVGGDSITIETAEPESIAASVRDSFGLPAQVVDGAVRLEVADGHTWISRLVERFPSRITAIRLGQPTLEDVFIVKTGHRFSPHVHT
jgi:ABC-2 type transport system ATP-binding protein